MNWFRKPVNTALDVHTSPFSEECPDCDAARWWPCVIPGTITIRSGGPHPARIARAAAIKATWHPEVSGVPE